MMRYQIYKPTKSNKGSACSWNAMSDESLAGVWLEIVRQNGWDSSKGNGIFKDGDKVAIKLNWNEVANLKRCLEKNQEKSLIHDFGGNKASILLRKKNDRDDKQNGFSFSIKKGDESYYIGLTFDEAVGLIEWFDRALNTLYES